VLPLELRPAANLREEHELPFVDFGGGVEVKLLQVDLDKGVWIVRNRFSPGVVLQTHRHTGPVYAFTECGSWHYAEYPTDINRAGSYLFEPAGSTHTLVVSPDNTEPTLVWFVIVGANLNLACDGAIESVSDAASVLRRYKQEVARAGVGPVRVIGDADAS
jgi:2,4'-dihydroxyacetophenone dioxygenase